MRIINNIRSIGLISDTHIPSRAVALPSQVYELFKNVGLIIHCGDIVDNNTLDELSAMAPLIAVKGNMDPENLSLNSKETLSINNRFTICVCHGNGPPFDIKQRLFKSFNAFKPDLICYGHTHVCSDEIYNSIRFLNPGSATAGSKFNSIIILNTGGNEIISNVIQI
jgi:putative phosphoesterase